MTAQILALEPFNYQQALITIEGNKQLQNQIKEQISHISIETRQFTNKMIKDYYKQVYITTKEILEHINPEFNNLAKQLLQEETIHSVFVNFIVYENFRAITTEIVQEFLIKVFFESSMSRGGKNRHGEFPPTIKIPIKDDDDYIWLRGAKAIDVNNDKYPSRTIYFKQINGGKIKGYQDFLEKFLNYFEKVVSGQIKHSRFKPKDLGDIL